MSYDYSENILVQEAAGNLLHDELGWDVVYAYNREVLGENGTLGRTSYKEILLKRDLRPRRSCRSTRRNTSSCATASPSPSAARTGARSSAAPW